MHYTNYHVKPQDNQNSQGIQGPQGQTVLNIEHPQGGILSTNEEAKLKIIAATSVSRIQLDNSFKILCILVCYRKLLTQKS